MFFQMGGEKPPSCSDILMVLNNLALEGIRWPGNPALRATAGLRHGRDRVWPGAVGASGICGVVKCHRDIGRNTLPEV